MRRLRQIAFTVLFAGWMLPALLAQAVRARGPQAVPDVRTPLEVMSGMAPPPMPAERAASMFTTIAVLWFVIALVYAVVLTVRLRRTLVG